ncbi:MAG: CHASE domain-containing protein [Verrucomicrobiales bacterium]|nr:CHASE domain-containing protein [Verrucomicrobiales bacterium]
MSGREEEQQNSPTPNSGGGGWRRVAPAALAVVIGVAVTLAAYRGVKELERGRRAVVFNRLAGARAAVMQKKFDAAGEVVRGLAAFYAASEKVSAEEFSTYTRKMFEQHPELRTLEWVQRVEPGEREAVEAELRKRSEGGQGGVITELGSGSLLAPAGEREVYFPTVFVEPLTEETKRILGYDNGSKLELMELLEEGAARGDLMASGWSSRLYADLGQGEPLSVLVLMPVYREEAEVSDGGGGMANVQGFVLAALRVNQLLEGVVGMDAEQTDVYLYEEGAGSGESPDGLVLGFDTNWGVVPQVNKPPQGSGGGLSARRTIKLGDRVWQLLCLPDESSTGVKRSWPEMAVLGGGLVMTGLLAAYLFSVVGTAKRTADVVGRRTADLRREIAERERAERTLKNSEALYHSLVENAPMSIYRKDLTGRIVFGNSSYARVIRKKKAEMIGLTDFDLFPKELAEKYLADDERVTLSGEVLEDVELHETPDKKKIYVHVLKGPVFDAAGEIVGSQGMFWDVTERKQAEQQLKTTADELARSNSDLEQFAYVASHDLQEPLRMVASYTQLLQRRYKDKLDEEANEFIGYSVDGAKRMQKLIEDLLAYSRVGTRGKPLQAIDPTQPLEDALANLKLALEEAGTNVVVDEGLPEVMADVTQLTQLVQNLLSNAIKFQKGGGSSEIHIGAKVVKEGFREMVEFFVRDNGIGIEEQFYERIFVIFQRLHTREEFAGTGIGLALCKKIIERHGGRIWVKSTVGVGTTFFFTLQKAGGD